MDAKPSEFKCSEESCKAIARRAGGLKEGANSLDTLVVCASKINENVVIATEPCKDEWHLPKIGRAVLTVEVREGRIISGTIAPQQSDTNDPRRWRVYDIVEVNRGLSGACVSVFLKWRIFLVKLYLDIPLEDGANPSRAALWEMIFGLDHYWVRRDDNELELVGNWLEKPNRR